MAWRTPVYTVFPAGFLNGLSSQELSFILQTTDEKLFYLNTLLDLNGVFLDFFPTKANSVLRDSRHRNLNSPTTQSLNGLGVPALSIPCLLCTSRPQQVLAGGARQPLQIPCSPLRHTGGNHLLTCTLTMPQARRRRCWGPGSPWPQQAAGKGSRVGWSACAREPASLALCTGGRGAVHTPGACGKRGGKFGLSLCVEQATQTETPAQEGNSATPCC